MQNQVHFCAPASSANSTIKSTIRTACVGVSLMLLPFGATWAETPLEVSNPIEIQINGQVAGDIQSIVANPGDSYQLTASFPAGATYAYFNFIDWRHRLGVVTDIELDDQTGNNACRLRTYSRGSYVYCRKIEAPDDTQDVPTIVVSGVVNGDVEVGEDYTTLLAYRDNPGPSTDGSRRRGSNHWIRSTLSVIDANPELSVSLVSTAPEADEFGITPLNVELAKTSANVKGVNLTLSYDPELISVEELESILDDNNDRRPNYFDRDGCRGDAIVTIDASNGTAHYEKRAKADDSPFSYIRPKKCNGGLILDNLEAACTNEGSSPIAITEALLDLDGSSFDGNWDNAKAADIGAPLTVACEAVVRFSIRTEEDTPVTPQ